MTTAAASLGKNLLAAALGLGIAMVLLEGGARTMASALGVSPYMQYHATLGWTATPNTSKRHKSPNLNFDVTYEINAHGHRGAFYEKPKPPGVKRIVLLGDSNGFGWGVTEGRHLAALLDAGLENVEVINLALSGYGTDQQLLRLREEGLAFQPDVVLVQVTENDFDEIQYSFYNQKPKPQFTLHEGQLRLGNVPVRSVGWKAEEFYDLSLPLPRQEWLGWNSYAYNWLNEKYFAISRTYAKPRGVNPERYSAEGVALFQRLTAEVKQALDAAGAHGFLVHASKEISDRHQVLGEVLPVVNAWPVLESHAARLGRSALFPDGFHWNEDGHRLVAQQVMAELSRLGYSPAR